MLASSYVILNVKLGSLPESLREKLLSYLPDKEKNLLKKIPKSSKSLDPEDFSFDRILNQVHYSWLLPTLKTYPNEEIALFLEVVEEQKKAILKRKLRIEPDEPHLTSIAKSYLKLILQMSLLGKEDSLLPVEYLPSHPLNQLTLLNKQQLVELIDYLGLYDLSKEIKQIVDTTVLKKIYSYLSQEHKSFLNKIMNQKEPKLFFRMNLTREGIDKDAFKTLLHKRGLQRLGITLSHQHSDLLWYITHILDIGRGNALLKIEEKKVMAKDAESMVGCVLEALKRVKP